MERKNNVWFSLKISQNERVMITCNRFNDIFLGKISIKLHFFTWVTFFKWIIVFNTLKVFCWCIFTNYCRCYLEKYHFLCFNEKNKNLNVSRNISHYAQILHNEPFNEIRGTVGSISDWVSERIHFETTWGFSWKHVSNCHY